MIIVSTDWSSLLMSGSCTGIDRNKRIVLDSVGVGIDGEAVGMRRHVQIFREICQVRNM